MPQIGPAEMLMVAVIALIVFGPQRLPEIARSIGKAIAHQSDCVVIPLTFGHRFQSVGQVFRQFQCYRSHRFLTPCLHSTA